MRWRAGNFPLTREGSHPLSDTGFSYPANRQWMVADLTRRVPDVYPHLAKTDSIQMVGTVEEWLRDCDLCRPNKFPVMIRLSGDV